MKKILTLFSALLLTVSMWGANEYQTTILGDVKLTDLSSYMPKYQLDFQQTGTNTGGSWTTTACMILEPYEEGLAGTYRLDDWTMNSNSYVLNGTTYRYVCDYTGKPTEIVITDNGDGSYTISGAFRTRYKASGSTNWTYYYYYFDATDPNNTFTPVAPDPYESEPAKVDAGLSFNTTYLSASSQSGKILFDLGDPYGDETIKLAFASSFVQPDAKNYSVAASGSNVFLASTGMGTYSPEPSYMFDGSDFYFIVGGSLDISYSDDNKKMTIAGTVISAHGTEITISATGTNPWGPKPEVELNVTEVKPSVSGTNVTLAITSSTEPKTGVIYATGVSALTDITISKLSIYNTYFKATDDWYGSYLDNTDANNAISITDKGNNVYELNAKLACDDGKIYVIKEAEFSYNPAYKAEPSQSYSTINVKAYNLTYSTVSDYILFDFESSDGFKQVALSFHSSEFNMTTGTYDIAADAEGKFLASEGRISNVDQPSYYLYDDGWDNAIYYIISGSITVSFSADQQTIYMTGTVTTAHGSTISLDLSGMNPFAPKEKDFTITGWNQKMLRMEEGNVLVFDMNGAGQDELSRLHIEIPASQLEGEFTSLALDYTFFGSDGVYDNVVENANNIVAIEKVQGGYQLGATLVGESGVTYTVAPAVFDKYLVTTTDAVITAAQLNNLMSEVVDLQVGRAFADDMWQTICLPFDIADIDASPLAGASVKSVTSCSLDQEGMLLVYAEDVTSMTAGMPYLIMWKDGAPLADKHTFEGVTIAAAEGSDSGNFVANMSAKHYDDVTGKYMVVENNGLAPMGEEGTMKGFRAYFQINAPAGIAPRKFAFAKNEATGTETPAAEMQDAKVLVNGQLMLLSGDKVYNVQAQELK